MLELENLGLVELNAQEMNDVEGGIAPLVIYGLCWAAGFAIGSAIAYYNS